jgi:integrase
VVGEGAGSSGSNPVRPGWALIPVHHTDHFNEIIRLLEEKPQQYTAVADCTRPTPHGLHHTHKVVVEELATPPKLTGERMGHEDGSAQSRYSHLTPEMGKRLMQGLTGLWEGVSSWKRDGRCSGLPGAHAGRSLESNS